MKCTITQGEKEHYCELQKSFHCREDGKVLNGCSSCESTAGTRSLERAEMLRIMLQPCKVQVCSMIQQHNLVPYTLQDQTTLVTSGPTVL